MLLLIFYLIFFVTLNITNTNVARFIINAMITLNIQNSTENVKLFMKCKPLFSLINI